MQFIFCLLLFCFLFCKGNENVFNMMCEISTAQGPQSIIRHRRPEMARNYLRSANICFADTNFLWCFNNLAFDFNEHFVLVYETCRVLALAHCMYLNWNPEANDFEAGKTHDSIEQIYEASKAILDESAVTLQKKRKQKKWNVYVYFSLSTYFWMVWIISFSSYYKRRGLRPRILGRGCNPQITTRQVFYFYD